MRDARRQTPEQTLRACDGIMCFRVPLVELDGA